MKRKCTAKGCVEGEILIRHSTPLYEVVGVWQVVPCQTCKGTSEVKIKMIPLTEIYAEEVCSECGEPKKNKHKGLRVGDCVLWDYGKPRLTIYQLSTTSAHAMRLVCIADTQHVVPECHLGDSNYLKISVGSRTLNRVQMVELIDGERWLDRMSYIPRADALALALEWNPGERERK